MQAGKSVAAAAKEAVGNVGASAKSGMDKTKAVLEEKVEKMKTNDPRDKEMAEHRKLDKLEQAEFNKQEIMHQNAVARERAREAPVSGHPMLALPGHGTGELTGGNVISGIVPSHPIGTATGTNRPSAARNPNSGSSVPGSHGAGGTYGQIN